uniref:Putative wrky transcription factor protein 1 n=1 Tax=Corethrella appendiculata TaxID=1370023 RepID=U5EDH3_9DIPT
MHGVKRVAAFCILTAILPASLIILPLYLRHTVFADVIFPIAESDIMEIREGISSIFCQRHSLQMNSSFNAFQLNHQPEISKNRKHIRLKKSMSLPDDTLEYWGFYLLKGATVALKVCSRYDGSRILVVKGERNLKMCGLLEHNKELGQHLHKDHGQVFVTFETAAEVVESVNSGKNGSTDDRFNDVYSVDKTNNHGGEDLTADELTINQRKKVHSSDGILNSLSADSTTKTNGKKIVKKSSSSESNMDLMDKTEQFLNETDNKNSLNVSEVVEASSTTTTTTTTSIPTTHKKRHQKNKNRKHDKINGEIDNNNNHTDRIKRDTIFDGAIKHGGNAINYSKQNSDESVSSFETSLLACYDGNILLAQSFPPSSLCKNVHYLDNGKHMATTHEVSSDGYYYYIFYSDNDYVQNDIHAVFDIYKPTYLYSNISESKGCINSTNCSFPIHFWSDETVVVEVPTRDGIEHEEDDITYLVSTCHPRMTVYMIFPITVLFLILSCAFL